MDEATARRRQALQDFKRASIIEAAKRIFTEQGLEAASIRTIAREAGYTSGAIYGYFPSKEAIYASILRDSGEELHAVVARATSPDPREALRNKITAMYRFYRQRPRDLELSLYLARGIGPKGLTPELNRELNTLLIEVLRLIGDEIRRICPDVQQVVVTNAVASIYSFISGTVVLFETKRLKTLSANPDVMINMQIEHYLNQWPSQTSAAHP